MTTDRDSYPSATVIVPTYNRRAHVLRLMDALQVAYRSGPAFDVVVVVDGGTDGSAEALRALRTPFSLTVVVQQNRGPAAARNHALSEAHGEVAIFLDDDVVPNPDLVRLHLEVHRCTPGAVVMGPMRAPRDQRLAPWLAWEAATLEKQYAAMSAGAWQPTPRQFYTANASVRRALVQEAGGFDERFTRAEDVELAYRLGDRGAEFRFLGDATVWHTPDRTLEGWCRVPYEYGRHTVLMATECGRPAVLSLVFKEWVRLADSEIFVYSE